MSRRLIKNIIILIVAGLLYVVLFTRLGFGIPCVFRLITGKMCPGCGMTHALAAICQGNIKEAWNYNALSITLMPILGIYLIYRFVREERNESEGFYIWEYVVLFIMLIVTVGYAYFRNSL